MADLEKLNAPHVPPQQLEQRLAARLAVADYAVRARGERIDAMALCRNALDMLRLFPAQDSEHVPTTFSRGRLSNSPAISTADARRRKSMKRPS